MKSASLKYFILFQLLLLTSIVKGQENTIKNCDHFLNSGYISDGQEYLAKLDENNIAKFYTTFYGGSHYRIIACSDVQDIPLILTVFDTDKNQLFCNKDHDYINYWNFTFTSTIDCIIEIEFDVDYQLADEVMMLIGFKEK